MKTIDAMGHACPQPVIMTKRAIRETGEDQYLILVDNEVATENLTKMGKQLGYDAETVKKGEEKYEVTLTKSADGPAATEETGVDTSEYIVVLASDSMGNGDPEFAKTLVESFTYALSEQDVLPKKVILYNKGVFLSTENEKTVADLKKMEEKGVEILSCGLCLDYYNKTDELKVGSASNMYNIVENMRSYHVVKPW